MKKIILAMLALIVAGLLAVPYWFGIQAEKVYGEQLRELSQSGELTFDLRDYERGWLQSRAETRVTFRGPVAAVLQEHLPYLSTGDGVPPDLIVRHTLHHGPLPLYQSPTQGSMFTPMIAAIESTIALGEATKSRLRKAVGTLPDLRIETRIHMDGSSENRFHISRWTTAVGQDDEVLVEWEGLTGVLESSRDGTRLDGSIEAPGLHVSAPDREFALEKAAFETSLQRGEHGLFTGNVAFFAERFGLASGETPVFVVRGSTVQGSNAVQAGNLRADVQSRFEFLEVGDRTLRNGDFQLEIRRLDSEVLGELKRITRDLRGMKSQLPDKAVQMMLVGRLMELAPAFLEKSPEIEVTRLNFDTDSGRFEGRAGVAYTGEGAGSMNVLSLLTRGLEAEMECSLPGALLKDLVEEEIRSEVLKARPEWTGEQLEALVDERAAERMQYLVEENIFEKRDDRYFMHAFYAEGRLSLNGRSIPLPWGS